MTNRASNNRAAAGSNSEDPLSGAQVEVDLKTVWMKMGSTYADFTLVPSSIALKVELLPLHRLQEKRKGMDRDRMMVRMWKIIKEIFTCVTPG